MGPTLPYLFVYVTTTTDEDITKDGVIYTGLDSNNMNETKGGENIKFFSFLKVTCNGSLH